MLQAHVCAILFFSNENDVRLEAAIHICAYNLVTLFRFLLLFMLGYFRGQEDYARNFRRMRQRERRRGQ